MKWVKCIIFHYYWPMKSCTVKIPEASMNKSDDSPNCSLLIKVAQQRLLKSSLFAIINSVSTISLIHRRSVACQWSHWDQDLFGIFDKRILVPNNKREKISWLVWLQINLSVKRNSAMRGKLRTQSNICDRDFC